MEHRLLEYFLAVSEELHFTKAAEKLGISQPTLSQQIRLLEEELGTPLFQRVGKKNYLTQAGQILLNHTYRVFNELEQAKAEINGLKGMQRGKLSIGCSGNHLLTNSIISFHKEYPGIELSVIELATEETREGLLNNRLDLGVVFLPLKDEQLESIPLYQEELVLVVSHEHELAAEKSIKLEFLKDIPVILLPKKFLVRKMIDFYCNEIGVKLKPILEMSTLESLLQMATHNFGATVVPRSYMQNNQNNQVQLIPIVDPIPQKQIGVVYHKDTYMSSAINAFIHHLTRNFKSSTSFLD
ncbi:LysR substrate-binding domain-containing protein [Paenibacillus sediminis]|uniref:DNA-binding transcriptional LysR family regulator n=1 Tax=Paenibacillus sediminis TaxID=664909 RepID=A0ABS4H0M5_9BACL|nr:LysR substrate-binding domain-containing protein [Paenibacillus sediminis]MBP1936083.1 DNA-binding transcriptional LysR family regulator [Paenibacillus sediminis]